MASRSGRGRSSRGDDWLQDDEDENNGGTTVGNHPPVPRSKGNRRANKTGGPALRAQQRQGGSAFTLRAAAGSSTAPPVSSGPVPALPAPSSPRTALASLFPGVTPNERNAALHVAAGRVDRAVEALLALQLTRPDGGGLAPADAAARVEQLRDTGALPAAAARLGVAWPIARASPVLPPTTTAVSASGITWTDMPLDCRLTIFGRLGPVGCARAAGACRDFRDVARLCRTRLGVLRCPAGATPTGVSSLIRAHPAAHTARLGPFLGTGGGEAVVEGASPSTARPRSRGRAGAPAPPAVGERVALASLEAVMPALLGSRLTRLDVSSSAAGDACLARAGQMPALVEIVASRCPYVTDGGPRALAAQAATGVGGLAELALDGCLHLSDAGLTAALSIRGLTKLDASRCGGLRELTSLPPRCSVVDLRLAGSGLVGVALTAPPGCPLQRLNLAGCTSLDVAAVHAPAVEELQASGCSRLAVLQLRSPLCTHLGAATCPELRRLSLETPMLTKLVLTGCRRLDPDDLEAALMSVQATLDTLHLEGCLTLGVLSLPAAGMLQTVAISGCAHLRRLRLGAPRLLRLDARNCARLEGAHVGASIRLRSLDVSNCTALAVLELPTGEDRAASRPFEGEPATIVARAPGLLIAATNCPRLA